MVKILECKHCGHKWATRREASPRICPKCKSKRWDKKPLLKYLPKSKLEPKFKIKDELNQGPTALALMEQRYLLKDEQGNIIETPKEMFRRVSKHVAKADLLYKEDARKTEEEFNDLLTNLEFLPGSPTLMNANTPLNQLASCFVLGIEDSLESIFTTLKNSVLIMQSGGGVGFNFSKLRPEGDIVRSTAGVSSGPTSFARVYDIATEVIKSAGKRRGAMMGILNIDHPDIKEFITAKSKENILTNFNLSIGVMDEFMKNVEEDKDYWLINPRNNKKVEKVNARKIFNLIAENAWKHGDPGLIFLDEINGKNQIPALGKIEAVNPCVTGDTLVAVADGRNYVPIKQLAEEGKNIPVYCYGGNKIQISIARNPRLTGKKAKVWKVTFDDESEIKVTKDHTFILRNEKEIKLKDLKGNTSLMPFYKYQHKKPKKRANYWRINLNNGHSMGEHLLIIEHSLGRELNYKTELVHHKNFDGMDNKLKNLELITYDKHTSLHQKGERNVMKGKWWNKLSEEEKDIYKKNMSKLVSGKNNGMYGRKHSKKTKEKIRKKLREKFKDPLYKKKVLEFLRKGTETMIKKYKGTERVKRIVVNCPGCGKNIMILPSIYKDRIKRSKSKSCYCSKSCMNKITKKGFKHSQASKKIISLRSKEYAITLTGKRAKQLAAIASLKSSAIKIAQYFVKNKIYFNETIWNDLKKNYPGKFIGSKKIIEHFNSWEDFTRAIQYNHLVKSIEFYGYEDVYNLTVDKYHTICYITSVKNTNKVGAITENGRTFIFNKNLLSGVVCKNCGEIPAYSMESCNLGSINLNKIVEKDKINWQKLKQIAHSSVHFLDNVININIYPLKEIEAMTKANRRIGLGIMDFANLLVKLKIPYNSDKALDLARVLMKFIHEEAVKESINLAEKRGSFPNFKKSLLSKRYKKLRNLALTSIAPTGSISILAGSASSGIEPLFAICYTRKILGTDFLEINKEFEKIAKERGFYSEKLMRKIAETGSVQYLKEVPKDIQKIFVTALDIKPKWHVKMQAVFQKFTDQAVSKTCNLPKNATIEDVKKIFLLAHKLKCKGITVYRYGSKKEQVLKIKKTLQVHPEYSGGCPYRTCLF